MTHVNYASVGDLLTGSALLRAVVNIWLARTAATFVSQFASVELVRTRCDGEPHVVDMDSVVFAPAAVGCTEPRTCRR